MKIMNSNIEVGIIDKIDYIALVFDDDTEERIGEIIDFDLDLDGIDYSSICFTTAFLYNNMLSNFKRKTIKRVYIRCLQIDMNDIEIREKLLIDMQCNMKIRKCRINGDFNEFSTMYIELEGMVM